MTQRIAILGAGVMGETLLSAILSSGHPVDHLVISERRDDRAAELREAYGVEVTGNAEAAAGADVVLLVVKPQDVPALLQEIAGSVAPGTTVVSLAAGIRIEAIASALPDGVAIVRAMPNTPALVGEGMFGISPAPAVTEEQLAAVVTLLESGGKVVVVEEALQDAVTAVSGSGPAYVFYLAEAMIAGGVAEGLDPETARILAQQTLVGSAKLLAGSEETAEELRRRVTSPNGTTHAAITTFDERGVKAGLVAGVAAAAARSAELSAPQ
ncbi:pyrroline-5-carboxylate reductase [Aeromicrobium wangtongii]|uniref:Pyrroline-5-carboxylate reductase n=1 Tax=Aeromicrobium wangtongii TaxID=2969247 RepID=A0ABY5M988_9ACTN|nr:pyrroline-5-carboxylate reductase [Aeromicrobium wangtongii]MCD9200075.1 pyrroline-5-carboxylate reductase [Aeromicrobium wangtongii]UUP13332.1 pyrroline-5-carboxylate reductase [Aeromicrobium wangtongii]